MGSEGSLPSLTLPRIVVGKLMNTREYGWPWGVDCVKLETTEDISLHQQGQVC